MSHELTIGSLCSGFGGLDLAVERFFGARTIWHSEFDPAPSKILAHHWPDVPNLGDMTKIDWSTVPKVKIVTGGTPCQDLSGAGKRAGMTEGTRSNLWVQMRECIAAVKPSLVIWENVRGAYSACADSDMGRCPGCVAGTGEHRPFLRALGRVLGDLSDLGFDAEVVGLRASDAGAPHPRFRVFVVAYAQSLRWRKGRSESARIVGRPNDAIGGAPVNLTLLPTPAAMNPNDGEGAETWLARRERVNLTAANRNGMGMPLAIAVQLLQTPVASEGEKATFAPFEDVSGSQEFLTNQIAAVHRDGTWGKYAPAIARWEAVMGRPAPSPTLPDGNGDKHRLNARLVEWMMGQPDGWVTDPAIGITRNEQLRALGNGVVQQQAELALSIAWPRVLESLGIDIEAAA